VEFIAFTQEELDRAIGMGFKSIGLCDNTFSVPRSEDITYIKIGDVTINEAAPNDDKEVKSGGNACLCRNIKGSFSSSYASSYHMSYRTSYTTSYNTSYSTSYSTSFRSGFSLVTSYKTSFSTKFLTSFASSFAQRFALGGSFSGRGNAARCRLKLKRHEIKEISVNGYGINLI
jgi:hypothetical protein